MEVLVVDDEPMLREAVSAYLTKQGYQVHQASSGPEALALFSQKNVQFIILDLMLPGLSGEAVCQEIRKSSRVPILMLSAKTREESILNGLGLGADDYVTKPFSLKQLHARMEAILRRSAGPYRPLAGRFAWGEDLSIDFERGEVVKQGRPLSLTKSEWRLLSSLVSHPKKVFSRDELMEIVFGEEADSFDRVIDTHIKNLRKKLESDPKNPLYIRTVHGLGYKFGVEAT